MTSRGAYAPLDMPPVKFERVCYCSGSMSADAKSSLSLFIIIIRYFAPPPPLVCYDQTFLGGVKIFLPPNPQKNLICPWWKNPGNSFDRGKNPDDQEFKVLKYFLKNHETFPILNIDFFIFTILKHFVLLVLMNKSNNSELH